eukprot:242252-Prymnesium_polylepis.1
MRWPCVCGGRGAGLRRERRSLARSNRRGREHAIRLAEAVDPPDSSAARLLAQVAVPAAQDVAVLEGLLRTHKRARERHSADRLERPWWTTELPQKSAGGARVSAPPGTRPRDRRSAFRCGGAPPRAPPSSPGSWPCRSWSQRLAGA